MPLCVRGCVYASEWVLVSACHACPVCARVYPVCVPAGQTLTTIIPSGTLVASSAAFVDPSDPSVLYVTQPYTPPEVPPLRPPVCACLRGEGGVRVCLDVAVLSRVPLANRVCVCLRGEKERPCLLFGRVRARVWLCVCV